MRSTSRFLREVCRANSAGRPVGITSICSANPHVLKSAMAEAVRSGTPVCVESTSNQVNQYGGYTGMQAGQFARFVMDFAAEAGLPPDRVLLGGDHLGPFPWREENSEAAMDKARELVRSCVQAGYVKIHLDASMPCGGDPGGGRRSFDEALIMERTAALCAAAEEAHGRLPAGSAAPVYVIGTEVPPPGGERESEPGPAVTRAEDVENTLALARDGFRQHGLEAAWERVIAIVVQPGVEFGDTTVVEYDRGKAHSLARCIEKAGGAVYEAHSTDYQRPESLRRMVEDHFAILKVGPWLTFAFREAVFALAMMEEEWLTGRKGVRLSEAREALEAEMLRSPRHWSGYYRGDERALRFARKYSYSDRCRYYWPQPAVRDAVSRLMRNLSENPLPLSLLSQYLPLEYEAVRNGRLQPDPAALIRHKVGQVLEAYAYACGGGGLLRQIWDDTGPARGRLDVHSEGET